MESIEIQNAVWINHLPENKLTFSDSRRTVSVIDTGIVWLIFASMVSAVVFIFLRLDIFYKSPASPHPPVNWR